MRMTDLKSSKSVILILIQALKDYNFNSEL